MKSEHVIQTEIRLAASAHSDLVLWRNSTGVTMGEDRKRRYGLAVGSSDLIGVLNVDGVGKFIAVEVKTEIGRTTPEQDAFLALVRKHGGFAMVARSVEEFNAGIARARAGESQ